MNKTKQLYKLFESFRSFLLLQNHMKYSTNIFSLGYFISKVLRLNISNNRICTKAFILILFSFSMPIFSDKVAPIFQRDFFLWVFPVLSKCLLQSFPSHLGSGLSFYLFLFLLCFPSPALKSEETGPKNNNFKEETWYLVSPILLSPVSSFFPLFSSILQFLNKSSSLGDL